MADTDDALLTIDELARRTGMTVRNLRAHQSRGLLPPPQLRGRTGYYGAEHVERVELIRDLQAEGFNLEGIRRLLDGAGGQSGEVLRFTRVLRQPFDEEPGREVPASELVQRFGDDPKLLERAQRLGLYRPLGDGWFEEVSPTLARAGEELTALGVPPRAALDVLSKIRKQADASARTFIDLFLEQVWKPFDEAGRPPERWPEVREALERVRPLANDAVLSVFGLAMSDQAEKAFGRELSKAAKGKR